MHRIHLVALLVIVGGLPSVLQAEVRLPEALIRIPDSVSSVFVAQTETAEFYRFDRSGNEMIHQGTYYMSIGRGGPGKQYAGDRRTPLGVYFTTERLDTTRLHEKYGVMAFPLDYPNEWDRQANRSGDGIWVHGVDPGGGERPSLDTDGCIALRNEDLVSLASSFRDNVTPVIVTRNINWAAPESNADLLTELEHSIAVWADSQGGGDLYAYLSAYDEDFMRWGLNKAEWSALAVESDRARSVDEVSVSDLLLLEYPAEEGVYLSRFRLQQVEEERVIETTKRLYWRRNENGLLRIIAEDDG